MVGAARGENVSGKLCWICKGHGIDSHSGSFQEVREGRFTPGRHSECFQNKLFNFYHLQAPLPSFASRSSELFMSSACWGCAPEVDWCFSLKRSRLFYRAPGELVVWFLQLVDPLINGRDNNQNSLMPSIHKCAKQPLKSYTNTIHCFASAIWYKK